MGEAAKKISPRKELLSLQKKIFRRNDRRIRSEAMIVEPGFEVYERRYRRQVASYKRPAEIEEVLQAIDAADLIYVGDYHTNGQSQRTFLRLLKLIVGKIPHFGIGLEFVMDRNQQSLNRYLRGQMDEETFLKRIQFKKHWYFDLWENFRPLFEFSRFHHIPLYGIEAAIAINKRLDQRDQKSAEIIARLVARDPEQKLFIFIGDLHIVPSHLPRRVSHELRKQGIKRRPLYLYQNSEAIYWQLAEKHLEDRVELVKISENSFCFMNTPPIVWQQSYLNWLENEGEAIDYADAKHSFLELVKRIAAFLEIKLPDDVEDVEVFTCGNLSFLEALEDDGSFTAKELKLIKRQILSSESYFIPRRRTVYLANVSMNHAAEEAAHYLKFLSSGEEFPRRLVDAFYMNIWHEALGFFGSKIINHKRKCFHQRDYKGLVEYLKSAKAPKTRQIELEIAHLILDHKKLERQGRPIPHQRFLSKKPELFWGTTHGLGYMLGDRLYYALMSGIISKKEMRELFTMSLEEEEEPFEAYQEFIRRTKKVKLPRRI